MTTKKIRLFLGGYVNFLNAQNINCRALSEHLDKDRFEVWTMLFWYQNAKDFRRVPGVHYLKSRRPVRFLGWIPYVWGLLRCDVAFLPKGEYPRLCRIVAWLGGCRTFNTIEGILDDDFLAQKRSPQKVISDYRRFQPRLYAITRFIARREAVAHGLNVRDHILYLGVESSAWGHGNEFTPPPFNGGIK